MGLPYLVRGNVFAVPVLRHHLTFAVQVRRAFQQLEPEQQDVIAVTLPESVRGPTLDAIAKLPRVSLVISSLGRAEHREVFAVTPADGIVEAIRSAQELRVPLRFVDQEVAPGHLADHFCLGDEDWPDDALALEHGAEHHLNRIAERLTHPPSRFEPVDSWRELYIAAQLQSLVGRYQRVLFVANATHVQPVLELLGHPVPLVEAEGSPLSMPQYQVRQPSLPALLGYLDSIPRLVEAYERQRTLRKAHEFDKRRMLLEILHDLSEASRDLQISIRHYQAFVQVLTRLLEDEMRISPEFDTVIRACAGCFPPVFRERSFRHLLGYFDQVRTHRIGRVHGTREAVYSTTMAPPRTGEGVFVARNCIQFDQVYELVGPPEGGLPKGAIGVPTQAPDLPPGVVIELEAPPGSSVPPRLSKDWESSVWPPATVFVAEMRRKAIGLARRRSDTGAKSIEFHGSMLEGMDFRRTLRSYANLQPRLYVKQRLPVRTSSFDQHEPVMWLFDGYEMVRSPMAWQPDTADADGPSYLSWYWWGSPEDLLLAEWHVMRGEAPVELTDRSGAPFEIYRQQLYGRVTFTCAGVTAKMFREMSNGFQARAPRVAEVEDFEQVASELSDRYRMEFTSSRWWEAMLAWAVTHAEYAVVLVAPQHTVVPDGIARHAAAEGKSIVRISPARFTPEELRRLRMSAGVSHRYEQVFGDGDINDPEYLRFLVDQFGDAMKSYW